jgi:hypothetical protein
MAHERNRTLLFLDWDDTVFPTSELFDRWGQAATLEVDLAGDAFSPAQLDQVQEWRNALEEFLTEACNLSANVVIVTNSRPGWVESCVARYAPGLQSLFSKPDGLRVVYAMTELEKDRKFRLEGSTTKYARGGMSKYGDGEERVNQFEEWNTSAKFLAMRKVAKAVNAEQELHGILSIGDMEYEHYASQEVAWRISSKMKYLSQKRSCHSKSIMVPTEPSMKALTLRLQVSKRLLPAYISFNGDIDMDLRSALDPLKVIVQTLGMKSSRCADLSHLAECCQQATENPSPQSGVCDGLCLLEDIVFEHTSRKVHCASAAVCALPPIAAPKGSLPTLLQRANIMSLTF